MQYNASSVLLSWIGALAFLWLVVSWSSQDDHQSLGHQHAEEDPQTASVIPIMRADAEH